LQYYLSSPVVHHYFSDNIRNYFLFWIVESTTLTAPELLSKNYEGLSFQAVRPIFVAPPIHISVRSSSEESTPPQLDKTLHDRLTELTTRTRVVVFMKGDPMEPRCGFSNDPATGAPLLSSFDVLSDSEVREAAKLFSDWPTFPQVFFDGEFIGGCDILLDMHRSGKLAAELERRGIGSLLTGKAKEDSSKCSSPPSSPP
uniref:Glutaredoxin domain-containing protein n=1 Tax=Taenia asiatica TaxID=60517 RepID=A0A0R3WDC2_TAEAS